MLTLSIILILSHPLGSNGTFIIISLLFIWGLLRLTKRIKLRELKILFVLLRDWIIMSVAGINWSVRYVELGYGPAIDLLSHVPRLIISLIILSALIHHQLFATKIFP